MIPLKGFCVFLFLLVSMETRFFSGLAVTDRDVWSSSVEKNMNVDSGNSLEVRFDGPAKLWTDALPIGNGRLGAMVWGGVLNETINLNEDTLWTGTPGDYTDPGALNTLSEVRKLVDNGQYADATLAAVNLSGNPSAVYQLLGDIKLEFNDSHATYDSESYQRVLDLDKATVQVRYSASGIKYMREYFASSPDQVIVIRISTNKPSSLNFTTSLDSKQKFGAPHLNINLQMNYWPSLSCNLKECQEPLFDFISSLSVNGNRTAKKMLQVNYGASGWVAHQVSDIWAKTSSDRGQAVWALWQMGGAWLCTHLWEHYTYTMDKEFLKNKAYPLMQGCASFLLDWLIEGGPGGFLETNPSTSPEHMFTAPDGKPASVSYSSTMDMQIIMEVFSGIVIAAEELGQSDDNLIERISKAQPRLKTTQIAKDGSIMEWAKEFEDPDVHHRHLSHLFGLFPGHTINVEEIPHLCKAAEYTLLKRGEEGPGWSTTWKAALWARLHNSEHAYRMIKHLFDLVDPDRETDFEGGLYANLFTAHPPFQIDANFGKLPGFSAAIAEMLVQSTMKDIYLLPSLPRDKWANGCVKGLKVRGGVTVGICWSEGDIAEVGLWSNLFDKQTVLKKRLHYGGMSTVANITSGTVYTFNKRLVCVKTYPLS
ncbi:hypothetical protein OROGR_009779 [Orobanche gracilis]